MNKFVSILADICFLLRRGRHLLYRLRCDYPERRDFGQMPSHSTIAYPCHIGVKKNIYAEDFVKIRYGLSVINTVQECVFIGKYTVISPNVTIITNNHRSTVSIPQVILVESHINDITTNVTIKEDVWVGARSTIMAGVTLGRGCIVGANALVNRIVPPYALVAGVPARIIGVKFSLIDIERHEAALYPPEERMSHEELVELFNTHYKDKKVYGCSAPLTEEQQDIADQLKKKRGLCS